jgi:virginiamycin A acetyltransferase
MTSFLLKIPILRSILRGYLKNAFAKKWRVQNPHNLTSVGDRVFPISVVEVGNHSYGVLVIQSLFEQKDEKLTIGNYVSIGPGAQFLLGANHQMKTLTTFPLYTRLIEPSNRDAPNNGPIVIEDEVWIGTNSMILSGVTIGKGAMIAAGSIVTKNVAPYSIVGGVPAKLIRYKFSEEIIKIIHPIYLNDLPTAFIKDNIDLFYKTIETPEDARFLVDFIDKNNNMKGR